jgi:serine/threonine protein phosphatase PrpC
MSTRQSHSESLAVSVGVQCHVGNQRTENQDRVSRSATPFGDLFIVADGIGGYKGGAEAAQTTVDGFASALKSNGHLSLPAALQQAVSSVNAELLRRSAESDERRGMGSTVVLCVVHGNHVTYAHAGDSRAYLLRNRHLQQLTRDHSVMERMVSQGILTSDQASEHPDASVLTRALGHASDVSLDIAEITILPGDSLLLCSDGLWAYARQEEIEAIAASENLSASAVSSALLTLALEGGGGDNISIQFLRFTPLPLSMKPASTVLGMPAVWGIATLTLASALFIGAIGMFVWNYYHPLPLKQVNSPTVATPAASPAAAPVKPQPQTQAPAPAPVQPQPSTAPSPARNPPRPRPSTRPPDNSAPSTTQTVSTPSLGDLSKKAEDTLKEGKDKVKELPIPKPPQPQ